MSSTRLGFRAVAVGVLLLPVIGFAKGRAGDPQHGKLVYERYCTSCHGVAGNGAGEFADWISPKPRDYRQATFKWRSTPSGSLPTDADLERTLTRGLYGTYMPTWYAIGHRARVDVISYIKTFSDRWQKTQPEEPIVLGPETPNDAASVQRGQALYTKMQCAQCHGPRGLGDGPSAHELKDDWGNPIVPYNLAAGHIKCGDSAADIYRVFVTGLSGTPMPSYADALSNKDDGWDLAHFIKSLGPGGRQRTDEQGP
jgi:cytochrome c oxidase cbb3-type subunit 2